MSEKAKLKRYENDLYIGGLGVIIFGMWDLAKTLIEAFLGKHRVTASIEADTMQEKILGWVIIIGFIAIIAFIILKIHFYIGLNATRAARGREYKKGYFVVTVITLVLSVLMLTVYLTPTGQAEESLDTLLASFLVDLTAIYVYIIIIRATLMIKKLKEVVDPEPAKIQAEE